VVNPGTKWSRGRLAGIAPIVTKLSSIFRRGAMQTFFDFLHLPMVMYAADSQNSSWIGSYGYRTSPTAAFIAWRWPWVSACC